MTPKKVYLQGPTYHIEKWKPLYAKDSRATAIQLLATEINPTKDHQQVQLNIVFFDLEQAAGLFDSIAQELYMWNAQQAASADDSSQTSSDD